MFQEIISNLVVLILAQLVHTVRIRLVNIALSNVHHVLVLLTLVSHAPMDNTCSRVNVMLNAQLH